jgi:hypothetical protein
MDREGYLDDNKVLVDGLTWRVADCAGHGYLCEAVTYPGGAECSASATVEVTAWDGDATYWDCFCAVCFEAWVARDEIPDSPQNFETERS